MTINWEAVGFCALPHLGGLVGTIATRKELEGGWFKNLKKPPLSPPNQVFGPVWTCLYTSMGYASYLVYRDSGGFQGNAKLPLTLYAGQLALNWAWAPLFFRFQSLKWSAVETVALAGAVAATTFTFHQVNEMAGYIMIPYLAWISFATYLSIGTYCVNYKKEPKEVKDK